MRGSDSSSFAACNSLASLIMLHLFDNRVNYSLLLLQLELTISHLIDLGGLYCLSFAAPFP